MRGNEIGLVGLDYHTDGSDLVGLMCLRAAQSGGLSCVANAVAIYNELVRTRPDLAAALYEPLPYDFRGEQPPGGLPYYTFPVFTEHDGPHLRALHPEVHLRIAAPPRGAAADARSRARRSRR